MTDFYPLLSWGSNLRDVLFPFLSPCQSGRLAWNIKLAGDLWIVYRPRELYYLFAKLVIDKRADPAKDSTEPKGACIDRFYDRLCPEGFKGVSWDPRIAHQRIPRIKIGPQGKNSWLDRTGVFRHELTINKRHLSPSSAALNHL